MEPDGFRGSSRSLNYTKLASLLLCVSALSAPGLVHAQDADFKVVSQIQMLEEDFAHGIAPRQALPFFNSTTIIENGETIVSTQTDLPSFVLGTGTGIFTGTASVSSTAVPSTSNSESSGLPPVSSTGPSSASVEPSSVSPEIPVSEGSSSASVEPSVTGEPSASTSSGPTPSTEAPSASSEPSDESSASITTEPSSANSGSVSVEPSSSVSSDPVPENPSSSDVPPSISAEPSLASSSSVTDEPSSSPPITAEPSSGSSEPDGPSAAPGGSISFIITESASDGAPITTTEVLVRPETTSCPETCTITPPIIPPGIYTPQPITTVIDDETLTATPPLFTLTEPTQFPPQETQSDDDFDPLIIFPPFILPTFQISTPAGVVVDIVGGGFNILKCLFGCPGGGGGGGGGGGDPDKPDDPKPTDPEPTEEPTSTSTSSESSASSSEPSSSVSSSTSTDDVCYTLPIPPAETDASTPESDPADLKRRRWPVHIAHRSLEKRTSRKKKKESIGSCLIKDFAANVGTLDGPIRKGSRGDTPFTAVQSDEYWTIKELITKELKGTGDASTDIWRYYREQTSCPQIGPRPSKIGITLTVETTEEMIQNRLSPGLSPDQQIAKVGGLSYTIEHIFEQQLIELFLSGQMDDTFDCSDLAKVFFGCDYVDKEGNPTAEGQGICTKVARGYNLWHAVMPNLARGKETAAVSATVNSAKAQIFEGTWRVPALTDTSKIKDLEQALGQLEVYATVFELMHLAEIAEAFAVTSNRLFEYLDSIDRQLAADPKQLNRPKDPSQQTKSGWADRYQKYITEFVDARPKQFFTEYVKVISGALDNSLTSQIDAVIDAEDNASKKKLEDLRRIRKVYDAFLASDRSLEEFYHFNFPFDFAKLRCSEMDELTKRQEGGACSLPKPSTSAEPSSSATDAPSASADPSSAVPSATSGDSAPATPTASPVISSSVQEPSASSSVGQVTPTPDLPSATTTTPSSSIDPSQGPTKIPSTPDPPTNESPIVCDGDLEHSYRTNTEDVKAGLDQVCDRLSSSEIASGESNNWFIPRMIIQGGDIMDPSGCVQVFLDNTSGDAWTPSKEDCINLSTEVVDSCSGSNGFRGGMHAVSAKTVNLEVLGQFACPPPFEVITKPDRPIIIEEPCGILDIFCIFG